VRTGIFPATRRVLAQHQVNGASGEVPGFQPLLEHLDLAGAVVTADALQTHAGAAEFLVTVKHADYLFPIKANQSALLSRCQRLVWHRVPVLDRTRDQAHGQVEVRTLMAVTVRGFGFPHAAQVLQVTRKTRELHSQRWRTVVVRGHQPDLRKGQPRPAGRPYPRPLGDRNGLHYVRDVTFAEDASQIRSGTGPQVMAALRHLVVGLLCRAGPVNLAAALRHHNRDHTDPWPPWEPGSDEPANTQQRRSPVLGCD
jgi:predicted transposase YbfD/YdcC